MTLLGTIMQAGLSGALTLAPAAILKKDGLRVAIALSFLAIFATCKVGGLIFAVPVTVFLLLFSLWVRFVGNADTGAKRIFFIITIVLSSLFLAQHVFHLPIRFALSQPPVKIASNVAGILLAAAMLGAAVELLIMRKRKNQGPPNNTSELTFAGRADASREGSST